MKTNLFLVMMLVSALTASAQFNKGRYLVSGALNFSSTTEKAKSGSTVTTEARSNNFSLNPNVGYFFMDNVAAGLGVNLSTSKTTGESVDYEITSSSVAVGPFVRYYLPVSVFFQGHVAFGSGSSRFDSVVDNESNWGLFNWGLAGGYAYFLNDYVAIEPMVGYLSSTQNDKDSDDKGINGSIYVSAAFAIYLGERN